jgi:hypothetical protein
MNIEIQTMIGNGTFIRLSESLDSEIKHRLTNDEVTVTVIWTRGDRYALKYEDSVSIRCFEGDAEDIADKYDEIKERLNTDDMEESRAAFSDDLQL